MYIGCLKSRYTFSFIFFLFEYHSLRDVRPSTFNNCLLFSQVKHFLVHWSQIDVGAAMKNCCLARRFLSPRLQFGATFRKFMAVLLIPCVAQFTLSIASSSKRDLFLTNQAAEGLLLIPLIKKTKKTTEFLEHNPGKIHPEGRSGTEHQTKHNLADASKSDKFLLVVISRHSNISNGKLWCSCGNLWFTRLLLPKQSSALGKLIVQLRAYLSCIWSAKFRQLWQFLNLEKFKCSSNSRTRTKLTEAGSENKQKKTWIWTF